MGKPKIIEGNSITLPESGTVFRTYGHFYTLTGFETLPDFDPGTMSASYSCRNQLVIAREGTTAQKSIAANPRVALPPTFKFDAVVIMMNPGSSKPLPPYDVGEPNVHFSKIGNMHATFVPTQPDPTQIQVARVMDNAGYNGLVVVNLSDLRNSCSEKFIPTFKGLEAMEAGDTHSLFCKERSREVKRILNKRKINAPIICAWGMHKQLWPLVQQCVFSLERNGIEMETVVGQKPLPSFYHPLASTEEDWAGTITDQLRAR